MLLDLLRKWKNRGRFSPGELQVIKALLPPENPNTNKLICQAEFAINISRRINGPAFEARIPFVEDEESLIECDKEIASPNFSFLVDNQEVLFGTKILQGGFLMGLAGCTTDGSAWPRQWEGKLTASGFETKISDWIPEPLRKAERERILRNLFAWAQVDPNQVPLDVISRISVRPPASERILLEQERELGSRLGAVLKEFYQITDGIKIVFGRTLHVLSISAMYVVEQDPVAVVWIDFCEHGQVRLVSEQGIFSDECISMKPGGEINSMGNIKEFLRKLIMADV